MQPVLFQLYLGYLGGCLWVAAQPGMNVFDGGFWLWYVGRYVAQHFTALS